MESRQMHSRHRLYQLVCLSIAVFLAVKTLFFAARSLLTSYWGNMVDYLYNYSGGFIRRGLGGELLLFLNDVFSIPPLVAAYIISVAGYVVVAWFVISRFKKEGYGLNVLIMGFTLGGIVIFEIGNMRRDYLELSLLIAIVWSFKRLPVCRWVVLSNLIAVTAILLHEAAFFFIVPVCILLTNTRVRNILKSVVFWIPSLAAFGLCCIRKGDSAMYPQLIATAQSLAPEAFVDGAVPYLLCFVKTGVVETFKFHLRMNYIDSFSHTGIPVGFITIFYFLYVPYMTMAMLKAFSTSDIGSRRMSSLLSLLGFQFLCLTPMFTVLSCDIVRVSLYWTMSAMIVWLVLDDQEVGSMFPAGYVHRIQSLADKMLALRLVGNRAILTLCALCIGVTFFSRQPREIIKSSPAGSVACVTWRVAKKAVPLIIHDK